MTGAANVYLPGAKFDDTVNSLALASSVIAHLQNPRMSALAKRVSTVLERSGSKADDFMRLNPLGICMSHDQVICDQVAKEYLSSRRQAGRLWSLRLRALKDTMVVHKNYFL